jgi:transposase
MVLLSRQGYAVSEIADITHQSDDTVRHWLWRFMREGCAGLHEAPRSGRPLEITPAVEQFLRECVRQTPREFGVHRPSWTTALLATVVWRRFKVKVTDECIRQHLPRIEAVCRRPTWTVKHRAVQRPGYAQKKARSQGC